METIIEFPDPITIIPPGIEPKLDAPHPSSFWDDFDAFYAKHGKLIEQCSKAEMSAILTGENKAIAENWIGTYTETVKIVLSGLATLGKIHPVISVAVEAFGLVVSLDIKRRENDKKVIIIRVAMQNMMCAMFQLRHLRDPAADTKETRSNLQHLLERIKEDIDKCSGDLSGYTNQKTFFRIINSKIYEGRFKEHLDSFTENRSALHLAITTYIAGGVDRANHQLSLLMTQDDLTHAKLDSIDAKVDIFQQLFCTPKEWQALKFIAKHGVKACVEQDELLEKLLSLAGEDLIDNEKGSKADQLSRRMVAARQEAKKDFAVTLEENRERFDKILMLQKINHEQVFERLNVYEKHQQTVTSKLDKLLYIINPDIKLTDPELQRIWKLMGYKTIAKAKHFVLTFRDHYYQVQTLPVTPTSPRPNGPSVPQTTQNGSHLTVSTATNEAESNTTDDPNAWLLDYLDVAHVRPIVEAMDIDGSGFISVEELNLFALSRPKDWSLLQWMVYWAAGWHLNIVGYREKIYDTLVQMHEAVPALHPANSVLVAHYLDSYSMQCVEGLLRFTQDVQDTKGSQLCELAGSYAIVEETNIRSKLEAAMYILASDADAILVGGGGRPESWLYPLLYLVLQRHLAIINLAKSHILNIEEMNTHRKTLNSIVTVLNQRKDTLQAIFSQLSQGVESRFESFAWGMFYASYKSDTEIVPAKNTLFSEARTKRAAQDLIRELPGDMAKLAHNNDVSITAHGEGAPFDFDDVDMFNISESDRAAHPLNGYWSCVGFNDAHEILGTFHYLLHVDADGAISGTRESWAGLATVSGKVQTPSDDSSMDLDLDYILKDVHFYVKGRYDPGRDAITAELELEVPAPQPATLSSNAADTSDPTSDIPPPLELGQNESSIQVTPAQDLGNAGHSQEGLPDSGANAGSISLIEEAQPKIVLPCIDVEQQQDIGHAVDEHEKNGGEIQASSEPPNAEGEEHSQEERTHYHMTRTHENVVYLRRYLSSGNPVFPRPIPSPARRRWFFAIDATMQLLRIHRMGWSYIKGKLAERRLYLDLALRGSAGLITYDDSERLWRLITDLPPSQTRLYESVVRFLLSRSYAYKTGWGIACDGCGGDILCQRYRCITCVNNNFSNQIDLCTDNPPCISSLSSNERENFLHDSSHSLLRHQHYTYSCDLSTLIPQCRALSNNVKKRFRDLDEERKAAMKNVKTRRSAKSSQREPQREPQVQQPSVQPIRCACCEEEVTLPCWVCVTCDPEIPICLDCEGKNAEVKENNGYQARMHWRNHVLLRINDSKEVQFGEVNNTRLQQELHKIASDVHALEGKVTAHLKTATHWIKASGEPGAEVLDELDSDLGLQSDDSELIFGINDPPAGRTNDIVTAKTLHPAPNDNTQLDDIFSSLPTQPASSGDANTGAAPTVTTLDDEVMNTDAIDHADTLSQVVSAPTEGPERKNPEVTNHLASVDAGLAALQLRTASLDSRMSRLEASLAATASNADNRLSRVESQLSELLSLLNQLAAR